MYIVHDDMASNLLEDIIPGRKGGAVLLGTVVVRERGTTGGLKRNLPHVLKNETNCEWKKHISVSNTFHS